MDTLQYPLNLVDWQGSQLTEHAKALVGTVNTASLNFDSRPVRIYRVYINNAYDLLYLNLSG